MPFCFVLLSSVLLEVEEKAGLLYSTGSIRLRIDRIGSGFDMHMSNLYKVLRARINIGLLLWGFLWSAVEVSRHGTKSHISHGLLWPFNQTDLIHTHTHIYSVTQRR